MSEDLKWCRRCHTTKSRDDFHRDRSKRDGLQIYCKPCHRAAMQSSAGTRQQDPAKRRVYQAVVKALRSGVLVRPDACERCGSDEATVHAHHADYSAPLDVEWLCPVCHKARHNPSFTPTGLSRRRVWFPPGTDLVKVHARVPRDLLDDFVAAITADDPEMTCTEAMRTLMRQVVEEHQAQAFEKRDREPATAPGL